MSGQVSDSALRIALVQMLADKAYPDTLKRKAWVLARLHDPSWTEDVRINLKMRAQAWAESTDTSVGLALRRALGEEMARDPVPRHTIAPASTDMPAEATKLTIGHRSDAMILPALTEETSIMPSAFDRELAIVTKEFERPPYWAERNTQRLADAAQLVQAEKVYRFPNGTYEVRSADDTDTTVYTCVPGKTCTCGDRKYRTRWCKHLIAVDLYSEVQARLQPALFAAPPPVDERLATETPSAPQEPIMPEEEAEIAFAPAPSLEPQEGVKPAIHEARLVHAGAVMYEAPYSATVSVEDADGYQMLLTVRKPDGQEFFTAVRKMLVWCKEHNLVPHTRFARGTPAPHAEESVPTAAQGAWVAPTPPMCNWHGAMKASEKAPGTWYCTKKMADGTYCRERWPTQTA